MLVSLQKQECWGYKVIKESRAGRYLKPFRHNTGSWQTDRHFIPRLSHWLISINRSINAFIYNIF